MTLSTFETLLREVLDETVDLGKREQARFENALIERMLEEDAFELLEEDFDTEEVKYDISDEEL